jgi:hypothetical protein
VPSSLDRAVHKLAGGLGRVATVLGRANGPREMLAMLGWDVPPGATDIGLGAIDLSSLVTAVGSLDLAISVGTSGLALDAEYAKVGVAVGSFLQGIDAVVNGFAATPDYLAKTDISAQFLPRLFDFVVVEAVSSNIMLGTGALVFTGIVEFHPYDSDPSIYQLAHVRRVVHWDRIPRVFGDIKGLLAEVYRWGQANFDATSLVMAIGSVLHGLSAVTEVRPLPRRAEAALVGHDVPEADTSPMTQVLLSITRGLGWLPLDAGISIIALRPSVAGGTDAGLAVAPYLHGTTDLQYKLSDLVSLSLDATVDLATGVALIARAGSPVSLKTNLTAGGIAEVADGHLLVGLTYSAGASATLPLLTVTDGIGITAGSATVAAGVDISGGQLGTTVQAKLSGGTLQISTSQMDSFVSSLIPLDVNLNFDLAVGWSSAYGFFIEGNGSAEFDIGLNQSVGPFDIQSLHVALTLGQPDLPLELSFTGAGALGPLTISVQRLGLTVDLGFQRGNLGPFNLGLGLKPPTGLGIDIDAGVVSGGGFISFDPAKGQYAGVLDVTLADIVAVKVIGVLDTKLPDGSSGYSFLLIITFNLPPIQLSFGFTLNGVGGLGGVNRTMVQDALRAGLRAHTLDDILFPPDPINNAPQIISDIESFFPPQQGRYLFGPMVQIGWGEVNLLQFSVGIILEVPDPVRLAILGEVVVSIPTPDVPLISFKIDVLGTLDFGLEKIAIDGTMYDSYVLWFQISGDMAFRLDWGANPEFLLSLGGFHPKFQPPPDVPALQRLSVSLGSGSNPRLSSNSYFAVTSNTLQFGANVDAYASAGGFSVHGYIGYDALFIFSPFSFEIDFSAGFDISYDGTSLAGIQLDASLSGPQPWHLHGHASFHILFFDVGATIDLTWGDSTPATVPSQPVMPPLLAALGDPRNWSVVLPPSSSQIVTLRTILPDPTTIVVHPLGSLSVRETVVPLDITITKFNGATPTDGNDFHISDVTLDGIAADIQPLPEDFAIAQFTNMSDADKLSAPSYQPFDAGVTLGAVPISNGNDSARTVDYQERYIDDYNEVSRFGSIYHMPAGVHAVLARSGLGAAVPSATTGLATYVTPGMTSPISVSRMTYAVASTADLTARTDILAGNATHYEAMTALRKFLAANPGQRGAAQVVTAHEVAT